MADMEPFTLVEENSGHPTRLFDDFADLTSAKTADHDVQYLVALRHANPEMIVTSVPSPNCNLLTFANAGMAIAELDTKSDSVSKWRGYVGPRKRGQQGGLTDVTFFAKYHYTWSGEHFVLYTVQGMQYIIKEPAEGEHVLGHSSATDTLLATIGKWQVADENVVWVYDNYWMKSRELWNSAQKAEWANVILDEGMKKALTSVSEKFFESKEVYEDLGVPWKRGIIFYGPPGNGKTISIKALMHGLLKQKNPIPTLYVKSAPNPYHIRNVFSQARQQSPCLLVLEDIETIVTPLTRSYFFNEVDGLENNDGILMVASTNYLDRLDPGLAKRPSRFDRKYLFPAPNQHERELYCEFWRKKLAKRSSVDFPAKLCPPIARLADGLSFAYMQEAFVASLLIIAREEDQDNHCLVDDHEEDDLDRYELWRIIKRQIETLRKDLKSQDTPVEPWSNTTASPHASTLPTRLRNVARTGNNPLYPLDSVQRLDMIRREPEEGIASPYLGPDPALGFDSYKRPFSTPTAFEYRLQKDSM